MGCRVGISPKPQERKKYWEEQYRKFKFRNWQIVKKFSSKTEAQMWESVYARKKGYVSTGGYGPEKDEWVGYRFEFG